MGLFSLDLSSVNNGVLAFWFAKIGMSFISLLSFLSIYLLAFGFSVLLYSLFQCYCNVQQDTSWPQTSLSLVSTTFTTYYYMHTKLRCSRLSKYLEVSTSPESHFLSCSLHKNCEKCESVKKCDITTS